MVALGPRVFSEAFRKQLFADTHSCSVIPQILSLPTNFHSWASRFFAVSLSEMLWSRDVLESNFSTSIMLALRTMRNA